MILDEAVLGPSGHQVSNLYTLYKGFIMLLVFWEAQIAISLGFYKELLHVLDRFGGSFSMLWQLSKLEQLLLQFTCQDVPKLVLATLGSFGPSGGISWYLLLLVGLGIIFHRFGRCPNHNDFLLHFISQNITKLVLVTLAPFGSPWGDLL